MGGMMKEIMLPHRPDGRFRVFLFIEEETCIIILPFRERDDNKDPE